MHADAALDPRLSARAYAHSSLTGAANLLIMPNADAAHVALNLLKVLGGGIPVGPILMGAARPAHIASQSVTVRGLLNLTAIAVVEAQPEPPGGDARRGGIAVRRSRRSPARSRCSRRCAARAPRRPPRASRSSAESRSAPMLGRGGRAAEAEGDHQVAQVAVEGVGMRLPSAPASRRPRSAPGGTRRRSASRPAPRRGARRSSAARPPRACGGRRPPVPPTRRRPRRTTAPARGAPAAAAAPASSRSSRRGHRRHLEAALALGQHQPLGRQPAQDLAQRADADAVGCPHRARAAASARARSGRR